MLTFTLILEPLWSTRSSCQHGANHFYTKEKEVVFLNTLKISLAKPVQEGPFQVIFARTHHTKEQKESNTRERQRHDITKIASAPAESHNHFSWSMMLIPPKWMVRNIFNQYTMKDLTEKIDEAGFVGQDTSSHLMMKKLYLCLALMNLLLGVVPHSFSLVTMAVPLGHEVRLSQ